jgi:hypothetical protein
VRRSGWRRLGGRGSHSHKEGRWISRFSMIDEVRMCVCIPQGGRGRVRGLRTVHRFPFFYIMYTCTVYLPEWSVDIVPTYYLKST